MPADRITSYSPWHVILILDDSGSMQGDPIAKINESVGAMINEMRLLSGGYKPYFQITIISFGSAAQLLCEAQNENYIEIDEVTSLQGNSGATNAAAALRLCSDVLESRPGKPTDFEPFIFFFSDGVPYDGTNEERSKIEALKVGGQLKAMSLPSGKPRIVALGFGDVDDDLMSQLATEHQGQHWYRKFDRIDDILGFLPEIGTVAVSQATDSDTSPADAVGQAIMDL